MRVSFYCNHCKRHLRSGDHSECRKVLQAAGLSEATRLAQGQRAQAKYQSGEIGETLAKIDKAE